MKKLIKFIKKNWFKISILIGVIIISVSISFYFLKILPNRQRLKDTISYQDKCSAQSRIAYKVLTSLDPSSDSNTNGISYSFENHYNSKLHKCFLLITTSSWDEIQGSILDETLFDSYGLNIIAYFSEAKNLIKGTNYLYNCDINEKRACLTKDEFTSLIKPYMAD